MKKSINILSLAVAFFLFAGCGIFDAPAYASFISDIKTEFNGSSDNRNAAESSETDDTTEATESVEAPVNIEVFEAEDIEAEDINEVQSEIEEAESIEVEDLNEATENIEVPVNIEAFEAEAIEVETIEAPEIIEDSEIDDALESIHIAVFNLIIKKFNGNGIGAVSLQVFGSGNQLFRGLPRHNAAQYGAVPVENSSLHKNLLIATPGRGRVRKLFPRRCRARHALCGCSGNNPD